MAQNDTSIIEIIDLHPLEIALIKRIRSRYRFGEIVLVTRQGLPFRIKQAVENDDLTVS